jgi:hypothetical protein
LLDGSQQLLLLDGSQQLLDGSQDTTRRGQCRVLPELTCPRGCMCQQCKAHNLETVSQPCFGCQLGSRRLHKAQMRTPPR